MKPESSKEEKQTEDQNIKKHPLASGGYIKKMEDGYYKAFRDDDTEIIGVSLPVNICLMAFRGRLPSGVTVFPSDEDIAMEPELQRLRDGS